jgi:hypothetical protein
MNEFESTIRKNCHIDGIEVDGDEFSFSKKPNDPQYLYEKQENFSSRKTEIIRVIITKIYNALSENYRIPSPTKVSSTEWEDEWFRARHPKLRSREEKELKQWEDLKEGFELTVSMLENVSVGENRGAGGLAVVEEIEQYFDQTLSLRKDMILQKFVAERALRIANNDPESPKLKKELNGTVKQEIESVLLEQEESWKSVLREIVDQYMQKYKEKKELLFFKTVKEMRLYKEKPGSIQPLDWWY